MSLGGVTYDDRQACDSIKVLLTSELRKVVRVSPLEAQNRESFEQKTE